MGEDEFITAYGRYDILRKIQQEMEDFLFGSADGPLRYPPLKPLNFEGSSVDSISACSVGRSANPSLVADGPIIGIDEVVTFTDNEVLTSHAHDSDTLDLDDADTITVHEAG